MSLKDQIQSDIKEALKNNQKNQLEALRFLFSEIKNQEINRQKKQASDQDVHGVIKKQIKNYKEAAEQYADAKNPIKAREELLKLDIIKKYLPPLMSEQDLTQVILDTIHSLQAKTLKDQGIVIKEVRKKVGESADSVQIVKIVRERLQTL